MIILRLSIIFIFIFSCNTEPIREEIEVGKTIKIEATNFASTDNSYNFLWTQPEGPNNSNFNYKIESNKMLFTPDIPGNYSITLLVESFDQTILYEETFIYNATGQPETLPIIQNNNIS